MKIKELIKKLKDFDEELEVMIISEPEFGDAFWFPKEIDTVVVSGVNGKSCVIIESN